MQVGSRAGPDRGEACTFPDIRDSWNLLPAGLRVVSRLPLGQQVTHDKIAKLLSPEDNK